MYCFIVANFHTHPLSAQVQGSPLPSQADKDNARARGVPGIVISRDGIYSYGPDRRESSQNPKGYPGPNDHVRQPKLVQGKPFPAVVQGKQWPEGTGGKALAVKAEVVAFETGLEEVDHVSGEDDGEVILIEWSEEDVIHGEPLIEG